MRNGSKPSHVVSAWCDEDGFCLGQVAVEEKSNEITAIPELLDKINVKGQIITIDASLLDESSINAFSSILNNLKSIPLKSGEIGLELIRKENNSAEDLISAARAIESDRFFSLRFLSPTAFKQSGSYTVLPDKDLILQSLLKKWNCVFPSYPLEDEDAFRLLLEGIRISDYNLRTTRFQLKDNKIPGFVGNMRFDTHLSAPLLDIWKILIAFSECSGIGIKTALGMGGVKTNLR